LGRLGLVEVDQCTIPINSTSPAVNRNSSRHSGAADHKISARADSAQQQPGICGHVLQSQDSEGEFKAGTYQLSLTQSAAFDRRENLEGEVVQRSFTIPEGWSLRQMAATLKISVFPATDFSGGSKPDCVTTSVVTC